MRVFRNWLVAARLFAVALLGCAVCVARAASDPLVIFSAERAPLPIVLPMSASPSERAAAEEWARVVRLMSGRDVPIVSENEAPEAGILLGVTARAAQFAPPLREARDWFAREPGEVGPDAFRITVRDSWLVIEAATPEALPYAVSWLLQRHGGARWLFPGEFGESIPQRAEWSLPANLNEQREPAYVSREIFLGGDEAAEAWAVRNGLRVRLEFSHALNGVFTARDFATHPEWIGVVRGERRGPRAVDDYHWQPDLASPEVARIAGERARATLLANPSRRSFSLGVNDTVRFDQGAGTQAMVQPLGYFRGMPDYSPLVFTFMNRAAAALGDGDEMRGRYLGCLAYFWCENVPPFPVDPRVIPYVTTDRGQFYDATFRAADAELLTRWGKSGVRTFGIWDYAYGGGFIVPRLPVAAHAEGIRVAWRAGARGYMADASPTWSVDAFKLWAIARWLWEPGLAQEELEREFFSGCFGEAAEPMRELHRRCETRWMQQRGEAQWLKLHRHEDQALLFPPEVFEELRGLVSEAHRRVSATDLHRLRVVGVAGALSQAEQFVRFDHARRELSALSLETGRTAASAGSSPEGAVDASIATATQRDLAARIREFEGNRRDLHEVAEERPADVAPLLHHDPVPRLLAEIVWRDASTAEGTLELVRNSPVAIEVPRWTRFARELAAGHLSGATNLARNGGFETAATVEQEPKFLFPRSGELPAEWEVRAVATETQRVALLPTDGRRPRRNLRIEGAWDTQVFQWNAATPGRFYVATTRARAVSSNGSDAGLFLTFLDAEGKVVGEHRVQTLAHTTAAQWTNLVLVDFAPERAAWVGLGIAASRQARDDWFEAGGLELREFPAEVAAAKVSAKNPANADAPSSKSRRSESPNSELPSAGATR